MELVLDTHYKYDEFGRYYYLTPTGAELITGIDELDSVWKNVERRLKSQGKLLKSAMSMGVVYDIKPRHTRQDMIEYLQFKNENDELNTIFKMLGEIAEWAYDVDGDRIAYEERNPMDFMKLLPFTVQQLGRTSGLIFTGRTIFEVPEDEYQVGY